MNRMVAVGMTALLIGQTTPGWAQLTRDDCREAARVLTRLVETMEAERDALTTLDLAPLKRKTSADNRRETLLPLVDGIIKLRQDQVFATGQFIAGLQDLAYQMQICGR